MTTLSGRSRDGCFAVKSTFLSAVDMPRKARKDVFDNLNCFCLICLFYFVSEHTSHNVILKKIGKYASSTKKDASHVVI